MGMSYAHAWKLVRDMNQLSSQPLVETQTGGRGGGGARLTPQGRRAVADFWAVVKRFQRWIERQPL